MNDDIKKSFDGVSDNTINNYTSYYNKLLSLLGTKSVIENSNRVIIDTLNSSDIPPNSIKTFITVVIRIKRNAGVSIDGLISYRNGKSSKEIDKYDSDKMIELNETLPSYDEIKKVYGYFAK